MLELYKQWDLMAKKKYIQIKMVQQHTAVALRQTAAHHGTGRVTVADSWFSTDEMSFLL